MLCTAVAAAALSFAAHAAGVLDRLEADSVDLRFELRGSRPAEDVVVVGIDDTTFDELELQFPFRRSLHARVLDQLRAAGARQIAYDVQFSEPTEPKEDDALITAVDRAKHVVLSTTEVDDRGRSRIFGGEGVLRQIGARAGNTRVTEDSDGVIRRFQPAVEGLDSFPVAAVEVATDRPVAAAGAFPGGDAYIDFLGPPGTVPTLSFSRVLRGRFDPAKVRGKFVVVGATAPNLQDVHDSATSGSEVMAGPEVLANAISSLLRGNPLRSVPGWLDALLVLLLAAATPLAALRLSPQRAALLALCLLASFLGASLLAFEYGRVLSVVPPALALALGSAGSLRLRLAWEMRERRRTRDMFGRFVPATVVKELLEMPGAGRRLPGTRLDATVMFTDLRGFTGFAEGTQAEVVLDVLNRYLGEMSEAILAHDGTVVSYMGDGIMAVFGSPVERPDHADAALAAAREMLEVRMPRVNAWLAERGLAQFHMGIGLNSGTVMSGTVGSEQRLEYAAIGDTTNVAARLEAMTKESNGGLLLAESTRSRIGSDVSDLLPRGELEVRGRSEPLTVWTLPIGGDGRPRQAADAHEEAPARAAR